MNIDRVRERLATSRIGRNLLLRDRVASTNDLAWAQLEAGDGDGCVVAAEFQEQGRGRLGRTWQAPRGAGLLFSVGIEDSAGQLNGGEVCLLAAVACSAGIEAATQLICTIKWPNDLMINRRKVGGILIESRQLAGGSAGFVVGIGINCLQHRGHLPDGLEARATSLELESPQVIDRAVLLPAILLELDRWLAHPDQWTLEELQQAWRRRCHNLGSRIRLRSGNREFSGTMIDVDPHAALLLQLDEGGIRLFDAADTTICVDGADTVG
ncbi:MAG: biotin--[acetyl-CoA-carboxylase] ligase [Planctomycetota bacterium]